MSRINYFSLFFIGFCFGYVDAQEKEILGQVLSEENIENVHVLNLSSRHFTVTNNQGRFRIHAKLNDTLTFSSVQHKRLFVIIDSKILESETLEVPLETQVNVLNEVVVGKIMTGNLESDMNNFSEKPAINFYDVGIPGYKGKPKTQEERRLNEATTGGGFIPLNPILNAITGRTKRLKEYVRLDRVDGLLQGIISRLGEDFLTVYPLSENREMDFFYFCSEDPEFEKRCKDKSDVEIFEYLTEKYESYQRNQQSDKN